MDISLSASIKAFSLHRTTVKILIKKMYTPRLLKITAANILIFIIKKQTVIKHSKTNIILIDIAKFNLVVLGILLHYDSWQEVFWS